MDPFSRGSYYGPGITHDDYNNMFDYVGGASANGSLFKESLRMNTAGNGLVVFTPDGTRKFRICVDNSGNIVSVQVFS